VGLSDTILKRTHTGTIPARFGLIWFSGFRGEDLNVIFNQVPAEITEPPKISGGQKPQVRLACGIISLF
jgi:hypothetical protein